VSTGDLSRRFPGPAIPPAHPKPPKTAPRAAPSNGSLIAASTATRAPRHFSLRIFVDRPPRRRSFFLSPVATLIGASLGKAKAPTPTTPLPLRVAEEEPQSLNPARTAEGPNADLVGPAAAAPSGGGRGARAPRGRCQAGRGPAGARRSRGPRRGCGDQGAPEEGWEERHAVRALSAYITAPGLSLPCAVNARRPISTGLPLVSAWWLCSTWIFF